MKKQLAQPQQQDLIALEDDVLELLAELNKKTFLWVELGLQTVNDDVAKYFNRAYETEIYKEASEKLNRLNIKICYSYNNRFA